MNKKIPSLSFFDFRKSQGPDLEFEFDPENFDPATIAECPGIYIFRTRDRATFNYPAGNSPIIYIGMSENLRHRLSEHRRTFRKVYENPEYGMDKGKWISSEYHYMAAHRVTAYIYYIRQTQEAKTMESTALWQFYCKYHSLPVGNGAKSFPKF